MTVHLTTEEREDEAWDALHDTDAARSCPCPSCNHYLPPGEYKPETTCEMDAAVEAIVAARTSALTSERDGLAAQVEAVRGLQSEFHERAQVHVHATPASRAYRDAWQYASTRVAAVLAAAVSDPTTESEERA